MEKLNKKILAFALVVAFAILMPLGNVQASLQANQNSPTASNKNYPPIWMTNIRNMEKTGKSMGLTETLNSDLTSSSESNGIDVHMMKSTEYGAITILSASGYGNESNDRYIETSTGNKTGVYFSLNDSEAIAGGLEGSYLGKVNTRYYDSYIEMSSVKIGDALGKKDSLNPGCAGWHSSNYSWLDAQHPFLTRRVFDFSAVRNESYDYYKARGVAVCGEGL